MIHQRWRLSEYGEDNLGLACTGQGLAIGRTLLIERRHGRFIVRDPSEIEYLLSRAYRRALPLQRLMAGLANVAKALNANDLCLAHITAVHLRIPALPDQAARQELEAADILIKSADWNPALHPRAGTPPNPGWFAPTDGAADDSTATQTAQNQPANQGSDATLNNNERVRLQPEPKRIDELADFAEWLANATPQDEAAIRAEIKRYFADVGWQAAADDLNSKLSVVLRPGVTPAMRQSILNSIDVYTRVDPAEYVGTRDFLNAAVLAGAGLLVGGAATDEASPIWELGWAKRGQMINKKFGDPTFPGNYPVIDKIPNGVATSVKSIDLNAAAYQNDISLGNRLLQYVEDVRDYDGARWGGLDIQAGQITGRAVQLIVPKGSMTDAQRIVLNWIRKIANQNNRPVDIIVTEF
jgi:contact-dependent growth inhibition (CDI) system restriction endonuclease-like protein